MGDCVAAVAGQRKRSSSRNGRHHFAHLPTKSAESPPPPTPSPSGQQNSTNATAPNDGRQKQKQQQQQGKNGQFKMFGLRNELKTTLLIRIKNGLQTEAMTQRKGGGPLTVSDRTESVGCPPFSSFEARQMGEAPEDPPRPPKRTKPRAAAVVVGIKLVKRKKTETSYGLMGSMNASQKQWKEEGEVEDNTI
ncbi:hypothetical protein GPALN_006375 [Globodera pallida]|nr:hypothetical protein GPALN_006375 [Globodera pallida]